MEEIKVSSIKKSESVAFYNLKNVSESVLRWKYIARRVHINKNLQKFSYTNIKPQDLRKARPVQIQKQ